MEEVEKLLTTVFIREVYYPEWLTNIVVVKKSNRNGICALILQISTVLAQKTAFHFQGSTS